MAFGAATTLDEFGAEEQARLGDYDDAEDDPSVPPHGHPAVIDVLPPGHVIGWHGGMPHACPTGAAVHDRLDDGSRPLPREVLDVSERLPRVNVETGPFD